MVCCTVLVAHHNLMFNREKTNERTNELNLNDFKCCLNDIIMRGMTIAVCNEYFMQLQKTIVTTTSQLNTANDDDDTMPPCGVITRFTWLQNTLYVYDDTVATLATKCITNQHQNINITWTCTLGAIYGKQHKTAEPEMHGLLCAWFSNIRLLCTNCHLLRQTNENALLMPTHTHHIIIYMAMMTPNRQHHRLLHDGCSCHGYFNAKQHHLH